jgi:hypothetical protein
LLAGVFDSLQILQWMYATAHRDSDRAALPQPVPLPRPGEDLAAAPDPASKYLALADVPAIDPHDLPAWINS